MARWSLRIALSMLGFSFLVLRLGHSWNLQSPVLFALALSVPAVLLGTEAWWSTRSFARSWPVILCAGIVWLGVVLALSIFVRQSMAVSLPILSRFITNWIR